MWGDDITHDLYHCVKNNVFKIMLSFYTEAPPVSDVPVDPEVPSPAQHQPMFHIMGGVQGCVFLLFYYM